MRGVVECLDAIARTLCGLEVVSRQVVGRKKVLPDILEFMFVYIL